MVNSHKTGGIELAVSISIGKHLPLSTSLDVLREHNGISLEHNDCGGHNYTNL